MLSCISLAALLFVATSSALSPGQPCLCSALLPAGLKVNCSSVSLMELTHLPSDTVELHVQDNRLTSVTPGLFDPLTALKKVSLYGNPFHCDCKIQYLRNWLLKNRAIVSREPTCASPGSVALRAITELSDDFFSSCALTGCTNGIYNTTVGVLLCCIIVLLLFETGQNIHHHLVYRQDTIRCGGWLSALTEAQTQEKAAHRAVRGL